MLPEVIVVVFETEINTPVASWVHLESCRKLSFSTFFPRQKSKSVYFSYERKHFGFCSARWWVVNFLLMQFGCCRKVHDGKFLEG